jgi:hypothetical protein
MDLIAISIFLLNQKWNIEQHMNLTSWSFHETFCTVPSCYASSKAHTKIWESAQKSIVIKT